MESFWPAHCPTWYPPRPGGIHDDRRLYRSIVRFHRDDPVTLQAYAGCPCSLVGLQAPVPGAFDEAPGGLYGIGVAGARLERGSDNSFKVELGYKLPDLFC